MGVWNGIPCNPISIHHLLAWGLSEIRAEAEVSDPTVVRRLLVRAQLGSAVERLRVTLLEHVTPEMLPNAEQIVDAALATIAAGDFAPASLARRLHVSRATLDRWMKRSGFVPPSAFLQRTRLILAVVLRREAGRGGTVVKAMGFGSSSQLPQQVRRHFNRTLVDLCRGAPDIVLEKLVGGLRLSPKGERQNI